MNKCIKCGTEFEGNFCPNCGASADGKKRCVHCGAEIAEEAKFCNTCGKSQTEQKNAVSGSFAKAGKWLKSHLKAVIASTAVLVAVIVILSVSITVGTNIFRAGKVSKINLGDNRAKVVKVLGKPSEENYGILEWYDENYLKLKKKDEDMMDDLLSEDDEDKFMEEIEESIKLDEEAQKLEFKYIRIIIDSENGVEDVLLDTKHREEKNGKKEVKKIKTDKVPYGADIKFCNVKTEVYYKDGSYHKYNLPLSYCEVCECNDYVMRGYNVQLRDERGYTVQWRDERGYTVQWRDEWGEYKTTIERSATIKKGDTINGVTEGGVQYTVVALDNGTKDNLPDFKLTLSGNGTIDTKGISGGITVHTTEVVIEDGITEIGANTFKFYFSLTSIVIPSSVTSIGDYAFWGCYNLKSVVIPDSVTSIGSEAFRGCDILTIYCEAERRPSGWDNYWNSSTRPVVWGYKGEEE